MSIISREIYHQKLNEYSKLFSVVTIKDVEKAPKDTSDGIPVKIVKRQYEIGGVKKNGIIRFYNNPKEFSLEFTFVEIKRTGQPEKYSQKLFLPITYSLEHILEIVRKDIFNNETKLVKLIDLNEATDLSSYLQRLDDLKEIQSNLGKMKHTVYTEHLREKSKLLEQEITELKQQRGIYSSLDRKNLRTGAIEYLTHRKERVMPIQKSIFDLKKKHKDIYNLELSQILENIESKQLLLQLLKIELHVDDVINRPRLYKGEPTVYRQKTKYTDQSKNKDLYKLGETLVLGVTNVKPGFHKNDESSDFTQYTFINPNWRRLLSVTDKTTPIKIDDFTFRSILHYHIASQFYNRIDLNDTLREKYNRFFITFTNEYDGEDKLYSASIEDILELIKGEKYKQYYLWNAKPENYCNRDGTLCNGRSISQNYRIKAYLNKITKQHDLEQLLLSTNQCKLIEKKHKDEYEVNYELMEARAIIQNDNVDEFLAFNYDPKVKELLQKRDKDENHQFFYNLAQMNLFEKSNTNVVDDPIEHIMEQLLEVMPKLNIPKVTQTLKDIVFSYLGNHIYQLCIENNITYSSEFIKKYPHLTSNRFMIDFITDYVKELNELSLPAQLLSDKPVIQGDEMILEESHKELENMKTQFKPYKRRVVEVHNNLLINAVIDQLIRQKKNPFNFSNVEDVRTKYPSNYELINGKKYYRDAYKLIRKNISNMILNNSKSIYPKTEQTIETFLQNQSGKLFTQIIVDIGSETSQKYWPDELELLCLSRLFGIDITINYENKILFRDTLPVFTILPADILNHSNIVGHVVIGNHQNNYYSTQLNVSQMIRDNQFLIHKESGTMIREEIDGTLQYLGILNMNDLIIDTNAEMFDLSGQTDSNEEIELGILELYRIDTEDRPLLFQGETEFLYTF